MSIKNEDTSSVRLLIICLFWYTHKICETSTASHNNKLIRRKINTYKSLCKKNVA